ncbi:MAG TPA: 5'/3'-nucleotidase SurE [bacterium]
MPKKTILITNDDGINSEGIWILKQHLKDVGNVFVVAPDRERSATGHAITLHRPLRVEKVKKNAYKIDGTPTDCVILGYYTLLNGSKPDLVISGINKGGNLGDDITYSGTVCAALEGAMLGIRSFAISLVAKTMHNFKPAAIFARELSQKLLAKGLPDNLVLNVNVPNLNGHSKAKGVKITKQGKRKYGEVVIQKTDPRGKSYYWIGGNEEPVKNERNTDIAAVLNGYISITPITLDMTDYKEKKFIKSIKFI